MTGVPGTEAARCAAPLRGVPFGIATHARLVAHPLLAWLRVRTSVTICSDAVRN
jgi:hypothetical protein